MVDFKQFGTGVGTFITGYAVVLILTYIVPPLIDAGETFFPDTSIGSTMWFGLLILFVLLVIVLPNYFIYKGLTDPNSKMDKFAQITMGVLFMLFTLVFMIKFNYAITGFTDVITDTFVRILFWIGLVLMYLEFQIIIPMYLIISGASNK